jgi:hypothetical protein
MQFKYSHTCLILCCTRVNNKFFLIFRGEDDRVNELTQEISILDERAQVLDKVRTSTISNISYINQRNRQRNVEEAEKAILVSTFLVSHSF